MRVAIVHYWLVGMRGGERVLEELIRCFPQAELFTHVYDPSSVSDLIRSQHVTESFIGRLPRASRHYQKYLPFMPRALEELDLRNFDLVISSESGPAKGVLAPPHAAHVCYCHTPMRYIYDLYPEYRTSLGRLSRLYFSLLAHRLRQWDAVSALRVDRFVANSSFVADRIRRVYRRDAAVVHPPVDLQTFFANGSAPEDYFLAVSELVPYKRIDIAIEAVRGTKHSLVVVGAGEARQRLERGAPPNVRFLGRVDDAALRCLYQGARALLFPGEEDFGIVPVEAMACGRPVIAFGRGGARDSVVEDVTGMFFDKQDPRALREAIDTFETRRFRPQAIAEHAQQFSAATFREKFSRVVEATLSERSKPRTLPSSELLSEVTRPRQR